MNSGCRAGTADLQTKAREHVTLPVCFCASAALFAVRQFVDVRTALLTVQFCVSLPRVLRAVHMLT